MTVSLDVSFPALVRIVPMTETHGAVAWFPVDHPYVEALWLPVLGPSSLFMLRRFGRWLAATPAGVDVSLSELSGSLGLGWSSGPNSAVQRTMRRLVMFGMGRWDGELAVRLFVPPVSDRMLQPLAPALVRMHDAMLATV